MSRDPVCGREVDPLRARAVGIWGGQTYYFCSPEHREAFAREPGAYRDPGATGAVFSPAAAGPHEPGRAASAVPDAADPDGATLDATALAIEEVDTTWRGSTSAADGVRPPDAPARPAPASSRWWIYVTLVAAMVLVLVLGLLIATR